MKAKFAQPPPAYRSQRQPSGEDARTDRSEQSEQSERSERSDKSILDNIYLFNRQMAVLDRKLAAMFEIETRHLNRHARRNAHRFPPGSVLELSYGEEQFLKYRFGALKQGKYTKYPPLAYTEHGVLILCGLVGTPRATLVTMQILETIIKLRDFLQDATLTGFGQYWNATTVDGERLHRDMLRSPGR